MKRAEIKFSHFLQKFPKVELPVTLSDESHLDFSRMNDPLPEAMVDHFIMPLEELPRDEYTEFIACFRLASTKGFHAIVYWRAGLMNYQYSLVTFTEKGEFIDKQVIAGTFSDGDTLTKSIATIDEDWEILIVSGQSPVGKGQKYDASSSTANTLELLPEGKIVDQ